MKKIKIEKQKNKFYNLMEKFEKKTDKLDKEFNKIYEKFVNCNDSLEWRKLNYILDLISSKRKYYHSLSFYYYNKYCNIREYNL